MDIDTEQNYLDEARSSWTLPVAQSNKKHHAAPLRLCSPSNSQFFSLQPLMPYRHAPWPIQSRRVYQFLHWGDSTRLLLGFAFSTQNYSRARKQPKSTFRCACVHTCSLTRCDGNEDARARAAPKLFASLHPLNGSEGEVHARRAGRHHIVGRRGVEERKSHVPRGKDRKSKKEEVKKEIGNVRCG